MSERDNNERRTSTYIAYFRYALVNDLNYSLKLRTVELADSVAEILLLLEGEHVVVGNRLLALLVRSETHLGTEGGLRLVDASNLVACEGSALRTKRHVSTGRTLCEKLGRPEVK